MPILQVWTCQRNVKEAICITDYRVTGVLAEANKRLKIRGCSIVLEKDGTSIRDPEILQHFNKEIFIILQENEVWSKDCTNEAMHEEVIDPLLKSTNFVNSVPPNVEPKSTETSIDQVATSGTESSKEGGAETENTSAISLAESNNRDAIISSALQARTFSSWDRFRIPWITLDVNTLKDIQLKNKITDFQKR